MIFAIYNQKTSQWVDILWAIAFQGLDGSLNSVDGPNAGRVIENAMMTRDLLAIKHKWNITTRPIKNTESAEIEEMLSPEFFKVRTDFFTPERPTEYEVYSNNITKAYVINKGSYQLVKLSFPIVER